MTALFVVMFLTQWEENKDHRPALIGVGCTALCLVVLGSDHFLLPAMGLIILAFLALRKTFPPGGASDMTLPPTDSHHCGGGAGHHDHPVSPPSSSSPRGSSLRPSSATWAQCCPAR